MCFPVCRGEAWPCDTHTLRLTGSIRAVTWFGYCSFFLCHKTKQGLCPWLLSWDIKDTRSKATELEHCHFCCILRAPKQVTGHPRSKKWRTSLLLEDRSCKSVPQRAWTRRNEDPATSAACYTCPVTRLSHVGLGAEAGTPLSPRARHAWHPDTVQGLRTPPRVFLLFPEVPTSVPLSDFPRSRFSMSFPGQPGCHPSEDCPPAARLQRPFRHCHRGRFLSSPMASVTVAVNCGQPHSENVKWKIPEGSSS